jgi:hypothetical protein
MIHVGGRAGWSNWYLQVDGLPVLCSSFTLSHFPCFIEDPDGTKHYFIASKTLPDGSLPFPECLHINLHKWIQDYVFCDDFVFFIWQIPTFVQSVKYVHLRQDP